MKIYQSKHNVKRYTEPKEMTDSNVNVSAQINRYKPNPYIIKLGLSDNETFYYQLEMDIDEAKEIVRKMQNWIDELEYYKANGCWKDSWEDKHRRKTT